MAAAQCLDGSADLRGVLEKGSRGKGLGSVQRASTVSFGALLAQARQPFVIQHALAEHLGWGPFATDDVADAVQVLSCCRLAGAAAWHVLLSPDGVVGHYDRARWAVDVEGPGLAPAGQGSLDSSEDGSSSGGGGGGGGSSSSTGSSRRVSLRWRPLAGQPDVEADSWSKPRHVATPDCGLKEALGYWTGDPLPPERASWTACPHPYLRGSLSAKEGEALLRRTVFEELRATAAFGPSPFRVTLYASREGLQTNLHADEHSGFLVQVAGRKRVVLFPREAAKSLRCRTWGCVDAPINRRSWHDAGVPDAPDWGLLPPFAGLNGLEVVVEPGEALYIPKGYFHDVLSRGPGDTLGVVLRCSA